MFVPDDLAKIAGAADLIELRLDLLPKDVEPQAWIDGSPRPVLATVRSKAQGGRWRHGPETAAELLTAYAHAGAAWLDVEHGIAEHLGELPEGTSLLASAHGGPEVDVAWALDDPRFARIKLARPCDDARSFLQLLGEAKSAPPHLFCVPYGKLAETRTLFAHERAFLYGAASEDAPAARGQPTLDVLLSELRAGEVTLDADLYGLVGDPPARSPSPQFHNARFRRLGRNALYVPLPDVPLDDAIGLPFAGFSVTMPYKEAAFRIADRQDDDARAVGVANTLLRGDDGWTADNTDVGALALAIGTAVPRARQSRVPQGEDVGVFIYGAGGYARAAIHAAKQLGCPVRVAARKERAAYDLAQAFDVAFAGSDRYERRDGDRIVINTTPAGADGEPVAAFAEANLEGLLVIDAPYAGEGMTTGLVAQALAQGAADVVDGRVLLRWQADAQAMQFARQDAGDLDLGVRTDWHGAGEGTLVLIGPRTAGKTTAGRALARSLGRPFVDTDAMILRTTGRSAASWIETVGFAQFRELEGDALERALAHPGAVVATGGGCVEHEPNRELLSRAPRVVFLDLDPESVAERMAKDPTARPRLPGAVGLQDEAHMADERRRAAWEALAHARVDASAPIEDVVPALAAAWSASREDA